MRGRPGVTGSRRAGGRDWHCAIRVYVEEWLSHRFFHPSAKSTNALLDFSIYMTVWEWAGCGYRGFPPPRSVVVGAGEPLKVPWLLSVPPESTDDGAAGSACRQASFHESAGFSAIKALVQASKEDHGCSPASTPASCHPAGPRNPLSVHSVARARRFAVHEEGNGMERWTRSREWWLAAALVGVYGVLAILIRAAPDNIVDRTVLDWVWSLDLPILDGAAERISWFTDLRPRLVLGFVGVLGIALSGRHRLAAATAVAAAITVIPIDGLDLAGGFVADRIRPSGAPFLAYPSGHTLGTIVQYGFGIYLVLRLGLHRRFTLPLVALLALPIVLVGPARVFVGVHWPTDVLGAYLLGAASVIALVLLLETGDKWFAQRSLFGDSLRPSLAPSTTSSR